jgi:hypothetical protein
MILSRQTLHFLLLLTFISYAMEENENIALQISNTNGEFKVYNVEANNGITIFPGMSVGKDTIIRRSGQYIFGDDFNLPQYISYPSAKKEYIEYTFALPKGELAVENYAGSIQINACTRRDVLLKVLKQVKNDNDSREKLDSTLLWIYTNRYKLWVRSIGRFAHMNFELEVPYHFLNYKVESDDSDIVVQGGLGTGEIKTNGIISVVDFFGALKTIKK